MDIFGWLVVPVLH